MGDLRSGSHDGAIPVKALPGSYSSCFSSLCAVRDEMALS